MKRALNFLILAAALLLQPAFGQVAVDNGKTGISRSEHLLAASAAAVILPSSGTSNASGQITFTTALPATPAGTVGVALPAGVVTAGTQGTGAGVYQATCASTTVCTLTGTVTTANAAYTQVTTEVLLATTTIPAGAMGLNGGVMYRMKYTRPNNANAHTGRVRFGGVAGTVSSNTASASVPTVQLEGVIRNRGVPNAQLLSAGGSGLIGTTSVAWVTDNKDTTAAVDIAYTGQLTVATDFLILESRETWLLP